MDHARHHLIPLLLVPGTTSHLCCHQLPPPCQRRSLRDPSSSRDACQPGCSPMAGTNPCDFHKGQGLPRTCGHAQLGALANMFWFLVREGAMMRILPKKQQGGEK